VSTVVNRLHFTFIWADLHRQWRLVIPLLLVIPLSIAAAEDNLNSQLAQAQHHLQQGHFKQAIEIWQRLKQDPSLSVPEQINITLQLAHVLHQQGLPEAAVKALQAVLDSAASYPNDHPLVLSLLADAALTTRQYQPARDYTQQALAAITPDTSAPVQATVFNNAGHVALVDAYFGQAISHYQASLAQAKQAGEFLLQAKVLTNLARVYFKTQQIAETLQHLQQAQQALTRQSDNYAKAFALLSTAQLATELLENTPPRRARELSLPQFIFNALQTVQTIATEIENQRLTAYAYGYLGRLYELQNRYADAQQLTRQAIFYTQQADLQTVLYEWEWQLARLLQQQGDLEAAIQAYQRAVDSLQQVRQAFLNTRYRGATESLRETIGTVYFGLADLLLKKAAISSAETRQTLLHQAQTTVERFKVAELQDYFGDDCVAEDNASVALTRPELAETAVLYPILLPDRTEILLTLSGQQVLFTLDIEALRLKEEVNEFRFELETRGTQAFLSYAQRLYRWLIAPLQASLQAAGVKTLVFVPDAALRTIPLAALHDGNNFLVEQYAVVTLPNLQLSYPKLQPSKQPRILLNGLSEAVQGYSALTSITDEVKFIEQLYGHQAKVLFNQNFTSKKFAQALQSQVYDIVHIASHGEFDSDPTRTFLLTYDGQLTMDKLENLIRLSDLRNRPVDLLTLSACQTAVGDDQAALGLAGIAIKAGAQNALASLWFVDDKATALLISEFYRQLQTARVTKAQALQQAQRTLLRDPNYQHPLFWAAFLLIGNWL